MPMHLALLFTQEREHVKRTMQSNTFSTFSTLNKYEEWIEWEDRVTDASS